MIILDWLDLTCESSIVNENCRSNTDSGWKVLKRASNLLVVSFDGKVSYNFECLSSYQIDWLWISQESSSDLWTLGVQHHSASLIRSFLKGHLEVLDALAMSFMIAWGHVKPGNIHTCIKHLHEHVDVLASRAIFWKDKRINIELIRSYLPECADDLGLSRVRV
jgi:hypothetical protein